MPLKPLVSREDARRRDAQDPLRSFRSAFHPIPASDHAHQRAHKIYFCGNSLGLQPRHAREYIEAELDDWARMGVEGHFHARRPWYHYHRFFEESQARLVGAHPEEVVAMNNLTVNLHLMMVSFYRPDSRRFKVIIEADAFPSDYQAVASQMHLHGVDPHKALVKLRPRAGEACLRTEDIQAVIAHHGDQLALVLLGAVNYYTGQFFDIASITQTAHEVGAVAAFDLAHAAGNVPLHLHHWQVDFAVWCTYKYLNGGPGSVSGAFVHKNHHRDGSLPRFAGWWGHNPETRFEMAHAFDPIPTAAGWQLSNAPVLNMAAYLASLELFDQAGMEALRKKSIQLTGVLEAGLDALGREYPAWGLRLLTPRQPEARGAQLSIVVERDGKALFDALTGRQVVADWRHPDVIRVAPAPLYNSFEDVWDFLDIMRTHMLAHNPSQRLADH